MTTLTPQEIAEVANTVQPNGDYKTEDMRWHAHNSGNIYLHKEGETFSSYAIWSPGLDEMQRRSQALALVEWLVDAIKNDPVVESEGQKFRVRADWLLECIYNQDTPALMRLVLELNGGNRGKDDSGMPIDTVREALKMAININKRLGKIMTGDEIRLCERALALTAPNTRAAGGGGG